MPLPIHEIFDAKGYSTTGFLSRPGQGCYIPAYQRPYSWDVENINSILETLTHGVEVSLMRSNTVSFLGTIIAMIDNTHATIKPAYRAELPPGVITIIDGQQRITTFVLICIALHELARIYHAGISPESGEAHKWIRSQLKRSMKALETSLFIDMADGEGLFQYYPRVIRAYDDAWSSDGRQAQYESPIGSIAWKYLHHIKPEEPSKEFKFSAKSFPEARRNDYLIVETNFKHIRASLKELVQAESDKRKLPEPLKLIQSRHYIETLWDRGFSDDVQAFIEEQQSAEDYDHFVASFRLLTCIKYLCERMAFTVVTAKNEDDAFDMFEALNTTGEPLTALETFKPRVIEAEGIKEFDKSPSHDWYQKVETYLKQFKKADDRRDATTRLLLPFALSETGELRLKGLQEQRQYLRSQFKSEDLGELDDKREFVQRLGSLAEFVQHVWVSKKGEIPKIDFPVSVDEETLVGLTTLVQTGHEITISPLSRFFFKALTAAENKIEGEANEFVEAIRATVTFSTIWKTAFAGANKIDDQYRSIMRKGLNGAPPLAARPESGAGATSLANYKKMLKSALDNANIGKKDDWIKQILSSQLYSKQKTLARYLLFLASHDSVCDDDNPGLIKPGRSGSNQIITLQMWKSSVFETVEHIAPQTNPGEWDDKLYEPISLFNTIGNLTLLPSAENALVGNRVWNHKRAIYSMLSAESDDHFNIEKEKCAELGLTLSSRATEVLAASSYNVMCKSVAKKADVWDADFVAERSKRLASIAWDRLSPWLF